MSWHCVVCEKILRRFFMSSCLVLKKVIHMFNKDFKMEKYEIGMGSTVHGVEAMQIYFHLLHQPEHILVLLLNLVCLPTT